MFSVVEREDGDGQGGRIYLVLCSFSWLSRSNNVDGDGVGREVCYEDRWVHGQGLNWTRKFETLRLKDFKDANPNGMGMEMKKGLMASGLRLLGERGLKDGSSFFLVFSSARCLGASWTLGVD